MAMAGNERRYQKKLNETAENFVYIGCRLKEIEAQESYRQDGAADIYEFAQKEYGLHRSTTQRFMAITSKFSIGGNSTELLPEYKNFGVSKLQEMLTLSDEDCQLLTDKSTVSDIRDFKNFNRQQASEEPAREETERVYTAFQKCIIEFSGSRTKGRPEHGFENAVGAGAHRGNAEAAGRAGKSVRIRRI